MVGLGALIAGVAGLLIIGLATGLLYRLIVAGVPAVGQTDWIVQVAGVLTIIILVLGIVLVVQVSAGISPADKLLGLTIVATVLRTAIGVLEDV